MLRPTVIQLCNNNCEAPKENINTALHVPWIGSGQATNAEVSPSRFLDTFDRYQNGLAVIILVIIF
jgi:hypothetical protein